MAIYYVSEKNKREFNEDSYCHMELRMNLEASVRAMAVADGMGGLCAGKSYSDAALRLWYEGLLETMMGEEFRDCSLKQQIHTLREFVETSFEKINRHLYKTGLDRGTQGGTTLSTAILFWDTFIIANCGDSPVYGLTNGRLTLLSEVQNVADEMVKQGTIERGTALFYQNKNRLTQYLGRRETVQPYITQLPQDAVDGILMGSDGALGMLSREKIEEILLNEGASEGTLRKIMEQARVAGEDDNQTLLYYAQEEETRRQEDYGGELFPGPETVFDLHREEALPCDYTEIPEEEAKTPREPAGETGLKDRILRYRRAGGKEK